MKLILFKYMNLLMELKGLELTQKKICRIFRNTKAKVSETVVVNVIGINHW